MNPSSIIQTVESHTGGMPTRIVIGGAPTVPGKSMVERFAWADDHLHDLREFLMNEPRGHAAMFGALLMPPTRDDADFGVLYMSASGFLPMCGHGTIGLATVIVERCMVPVTEPLTEVRLDTPAGLVVASVEVNAGRATDVTFKNVPSFVIARNESVVIPDLGSVSVDVAFGGNFYVILDVTQLGKLLQPADLRCLTDLGLAVIEATRNSVAIKHPTDPAMTQLRAAILSTPSSASQPARNLMVKEPGYFDRSPCGTGTCARMALAHHAGQLELGQTFVHESILGTRFEGRLLEKTMVGDTPAVIPEIKGRAWITGAAQFTLEGTDPFPRGFRF
jgi:proline racemase